VIPQIWCALLVVGDSESDSPQALVAEILALMEISVEGRTTMTENGAAFYRKELSFLFGAEWFGEHFKRLAK
jgi:hypothetical protein